MVMANCWYKRPVTPPMKATGTKTAQRISAIATTGPETSFIAWRVASIGDLPCSRWCCTASTTTIASSTTMPIARTNPNIVSVLTLKPSKGNAMNTPSRDTGTVSIGMIVARKLCKKTNTTISTRTIASKSVCTISFIDALIGSVESSVMLYSMSGGKRVAASLRMALTLAAVCKALAPGAR